MGQLRQTRLWQARPEALRVPTLAYCLRHDTGDSQLVVYVVHTQELLMFNAVGTGVFFLLDGQRTIADIVEALLDVLPTDPTVALHDVSLFLEDLAARGVLSFRIPPGEAV